MIQLAICQCALPMADLACPMLLQLTLCLLVVLDTCLFLSAGPRPPQNPSQAWALSLEQNGLLYNWSEEHWNPWDQTRKAQPCVVSPLRTDQRITCSLYSGKSTCIRNCWVLVQWMCVCDRHPSILSAHHPFLSDTMTFSSPFSIHKVLVALTQIPALAWPTRATQHILDTGIVSEMCTWLQLGQWQSYLRIIEMLSARVTKFIECNLDLLLAIFVPT